MFALPEGFALDHVVEALAVAHAHLAVDAADVVLGGAQMCIRDRVDAHFVAAGISIAALSFLGFDGMSTLAEETREPEKNIGRGIIIALSIIIVVFVAQTYICLLYTSCCPGSGAKRCRCAGRRLRRGPLFGWRERRVGKGCLLYTSRCV